MAIFVPSPTASQVRRPSLAGHPTTTSADFVGVADVDCVGFFPGHTLDTCPVARRPNSRPSTTAKMLCPLHIRILGICEKFLRVKVTCKTWSPVAVSVFPATVVTSAI